MKHLYLALLLSTALLFTACETRVINRGYVIDSVDFSEIKPRKDTAETILMKYGSPTMRSSIANADGGFSWYYVSKKMEKKSFLDPKVNDQKTMIINFDKYGTVVSVAESTYEKPVEMSKASTKEEGKGAGILQETFGGLGKYREQFESRKGK